MVMDYSDIYESIEGKIPVQDWYTPEWHADSDGATITVYRDDWIGEDELEACFYSFGQGDDPEEHPIVLSIHLGEVLESHSEKMHELEDRIQEELKPLIGWEIVKEGDLFARKEFPSDPLTLQPRLLEEFKKLEPIAKRIDQMLGYLEDSQDVDVDSSDEQPENDEAEPVE
ncbi:MAG: hypothetical protein ABEK50_15430 [bacterium]